MRLTYLQGARAICRHAIGERDPLAAARLLQQSIRAAAHDPAWPSGVSMHPRMAIHVGEINVQEGHYSGPLFYRCRRLLDLALGEQILVSHTTAELVQDVLPPDLSLRQVAARRLAEDQPPSAIYQLESPGLVTGLPLLTPPTNLPEPATEIVGRQQDLAQLSALLASSAHHVITLLGAGGSGKTRLALEVAWNAMREFRFPDGVWFVDLAAVDPNTPLEQAVAYAMHLPDSSGGSVRQALVEYLKDRDTLVILDTCECGTSAAASLTSALLRACPRLRLLATSRELLGTQREVAYPVPLLATPDSAPSHTLDELAQVESVCLFAQRARQWRPEFCLTEENAQAIAEICQRLEGIPLAIELAAARVVSLSPRRIAQRLEEHRLGLLTHGAADDGESERQMTLRKTIDWSYALLRRSGAFTGWWTLESMEEVCSDGDVARAEVVDLLDALVRKSLVVEDTSGDESYFRLLDTIREYVTDLQNADERLALSQRHIARYAALARHAEDALLEEHAGDWVALLTRENANLQAALHWSLVQGAQRAAGTEMVAALWRLWWMRGDLRNGQSWLARALACTDVLAPATRAKLLIAAGTMAESLNDAARAGALYRAALALYRDLADTPGISKALSVLGDNAYDAEEYRQATIYYRESLRIDRGLHAEHGVSVALNGLGNVEYDRCNFKRALVLYQASLDIDQRARRGHFHAVHRLLRSATRYARGCRRQVRHEHRV